MSLFILLNLNKNVLYFVLWSTLMMSVVETVAFWEITEHTLGKDI